MNFLAVFFQLTNRWCRQIYECELSIGESELLIDQKMKRSYKSARFEYQNYLAKEMNETNKKLKDMGT